LPVEDQLLVPQTIPTLK